MPLGFCFGCCGTSSSWTITVRNCDGSGRSGVAVTMTQGTSTYSGTTGAGGTVTFTGLTSGAASATATAPTSRFANTTISVTLGSGANATNLSLAVASGYVCAPTCPDPISTTLYGTYWCYASSADYFANVLTASSITFAFDFTAGLWISTTALNYYDGGVSYCGSPQLLQVKPTIGHTTGSWKYGETYSCSGGPFNHRWLSTARNPVCSPFVADYRGYSMGIGPLIGSIYATE